MSLRDNFAEPAADPTYATPLYLWVTLRSYLTCALCRLCCAV